MQGWEGEQWEVECQAWAPETIGTGKAAVGEAAAEVVAVTADRCAMIAPTGQLMHPIFDGGGTLTG